MGKINEETAPCAPNYKDECERLTHILDRLDHRNELLSVQNEILTKEIIRLRSMLENA